MLFGVKNGRPTYARAITKAFHEYIDVFMKIFLYDFIVFNHLSAHIEKLKKFSSSVEKVWHWFQSR
jgi:hypothetical protein